jgi:hypothetical protein
MNYAFLTAAALSAFAMVAHIMLGRKHPLPPPMDPFEIPLYMDALFGRHCFVLILAAMAVCFGYVAREDHNAGDLALVITSLAGVLAVVRLILAIPARMPRLDYGEWSLMASASIVGVIGIVLPRHVTF